MSRPIDERIKRTSALLRGVEESLQGERAQVRKLLVKERARLTGQIGKVSGQAAHQNNAWLEQLERRARAADVPPPAPPPPPTPPIVAAPPPVSPASRKRVTVRVAGQARVLAVPAAAHRDDLAALRRSLDRSHRWSHRALLENRRDIAALTRAQRALARIVAQMQSKGDFALLESLLDRMRTTEGRTSELAKAQEQLLSAQQDTDKMVKRGGRNMGRRLDMFKRSAQIQKLNGAATTMQTAALGESGRLLARNNLLLAGNELLWGFMGDIAKGLGLAGAGGMSPLGWLSPLGSLATSRAVIPAPEPPVVPNLPGPPARYITGVASGFVANGLDRAEVSLSLETLVPADQWVEFSARTNVPVTVTVNNPLDPSETHQVWAAVNLGTLTIIITFQQQNFDAQEYIDGGLSAQWLLDLMAPSVDIGPPPA